METISGGPSEEFLPDTILQAAKLNKALENWVVTDVPGEDEGEIGDVVFVTGPGDGGSGSSTSSPEWQDWDVDWLTTFTPGDSIITSRYLQQGVTVHAFADVTLQSGFAFNQPLMCAPPVPPKSNAAARAVVGNVNLMLNAVGYPMEGTFHRTNCTTTRMWIGRLAVNTSNLQVTDISQTQPGNWAIGDNFRFSMIYEVAEDSVYRSILDGNLSKTEIKQKLLKLGLTNEEVEAMTNG